MAKSGSFLIDRDATPIGHMPVYRRIDPAYPGRRFTITQIELMQIGGREPDAAIYQYNSLLDIWILKDGV